MLLLVNEYSKVKDSIFLICPFSIISGLKFKIAIDLFLPLLIEKSLTKSLGILSLIMFLERLTERIENLTFFI